MQLWILYVSHTLRLHNKVLHRKGKASVHATEACRWSIGIAPPILKLGHYMKVSGKRNTTAASSPWEIIPVLAEHETVWTPKAMCTFGRKQD